MQTSRLSLATLDRVPQASRPGFDPRRVAPGVVHFGPGAFFRAHQAPVYDRLLASGDPRWGVCGVSLHSGAVGEALRPQDGLYALKRLGSDEPVQVIGALREVLTAPDEPEGVRERLASERTVCITLTVTEKGHHLSHAGQLDTNAGAIVRDLEGQATPTTIYGWLVPALAARRAAGLAPPLLLSCDNLSGNGPKLKAALAAFAHAGGDAALADWIVDEVTAPASMVDSITPASDAALRADVAAAIGLEDAWPVQREPFAQWVIEAANHPLLAALEGAGVTLTLELAGHERAKLRLLNGAHSTLAYLGLLAGLETVAEAMAEPRLAVFVERLMRQDLQPTLTPPAGLDLAAYVTTILARFRNPAIRHALAQIAADGSQKLPVRLGAPAAEAAERGADLRRFAVSFAAWMRWVERAGSRLQDPRAGELAASVARRRDDPVGFFEEVGVLPAALRQDGDFVAALRAAHHALGADGPLSALG